MTLVVMACSSNDDTASTETTATATATVETTTTTAAESTTTVAFAPPTITDATVEMSDTNVLLGTLDVTTDVPATLEVTLDDGERSQVLVTTTNAVTEHTVPLRGLLADRSQTISVVALAGDAASEATEVEVTTEPVPFTLPDLNVVTREPDAMQPGYTMFNIVATANVLGGGSDDPSQPAGLLVAVDDRGEIVWYQTQPRFIADARLLDDGHLLYDTEDTEVVLSDLDGNVLRRWHTALHPDEPPTDDAPITQVQTDSLHHEVSMLPNGNLLSLSTRMHTLAAEAPLCGEAAGEFNGEYLLVSDVVVEVDAETGALVKEIDLYDVLDPASDPVRRDVCGTAFQNDNVFPVPQYTTPENAGRVVDWTHSNAVVLDTERNALLVSARHLDVILAIRYEDDENGPAGELLWELGEDGTIPLDGTDPSHQHAVEVLDDGSLVMYDNGNERPEPQQSRAVRVAVDDSDPDPTAWTATQLWEWGSTVDGAPAFALAVGDADTQENGNVLITNGFYAGRFGGLHAQIQEVTPDGANNAEVVWELQVSGDGAWFVYRAERLASLYPTPI